MKKILTTLALVAGATLLHAQGFIIFNGSVANIQTNVSVFGQPTNSIAFGKTTGSGTLPGAYDYALLYSASVPTGGAQDPAWSLMTPNGGGTLLGNNGAAPGSLTGPGTTSGVAVNLPAGVAVNVMLVGWSASLGGSWATVLNQLSTGNWNPIGGYFGETGVSSMTPFVTAGAGDPAVFTSMFANGSLVLYAVPVPEPATIALASLGGLSLLAFRRRNKA